MLCPLIQAVECKLNTRGHHTCMQNNSNYSHLEPFILLVPKPLHTLDYTVNFLCCSHSLPVIITRGQPTPHSKIHSCCCGSDALHYSRHLHTKVSHKQYNYIYLKLRHPDSQFHSQNPSLDSISTAQHMAHFWGDSLLLACN